MPQGWTRVEEPTATPPQGWTRVADAIPLSQAGAVPRKVEGQRDVDAEEARFQAQHATSAYIAETLKNAPGDAIEILKGAASLLMSGAAAQDRRVPDSTTSPVPGMLSHAADYLHPDRYALMLREAPVGTAADIAVAAEGGLSAARGVARVGPAVAERATTVARSPVTRATVNAALDAAPFVGRVREAALLRKVVRAGESESVAARPGLPTSQAGKVAPPRVTSSQTFAAPVRQVVAPPPLRMSTASPIAPEAVTPGPGVSTSQAVRVAPPTSKVSAPPVARPATRRAVAKPQVQPADPPPAASVPQTRPATPAERPPSARQRPHPEGGVWSPQRIQSELGLAARRGAVTLTEAEYQAAGELVAQGKSPAEAIARTVGARQAAVAAQPASPAPPAAATKFKMNVAEVKVYDRLRAIGLTHEAALESIEEQRGLVAKLGTPSAEAVRKQIKSRQYKN